MAYSDVATLAGNAAFIVQSKVAMIRHAIFIGGQTAVNDEKTRLAAQILSSPSTWAPFFVDTVANQLESLGQFTSPTDAQVLAATQTVFAATARR
jgi:hypothetical protein